MSKKQKYYVVWKGVSPGIYTSWTDCQLQIKGYEGAQYKSFDTLEEAEQALASTPYQYIGTHQSKLVTHTPKSLPENFDMNCVAVDAACSGNPGPMEYRGVYLLTGQQIFHFGPVYGTNNIGEFLAIVHALAYIKKNGWDMKVYSDSVSGMAWVRNRKAKTTLKRDEKTAQVLDLVIRAENWLWQNPDHAQVLKWNTEEWGEIPADFGRK